jgi:hypothetical protein
VARLTVTLDEEHAGKLARAAQQRNLIVLVLVARAALN